MEGNHSYLCLPCPGGTYSVTSDNTDTEAQATRQRRWQPGGGRIRSNSIMIEDTHATIISHEVFRKWSTPVNYMEPPQYAPASEPRYGSRTVSPDQSAPTQRSPTLPWVGGGGGCGCGLPAT